MTEGKMEVMNGNGAALLESVIIHGDLAQLSPEERVDYYRRVCASVGLNPLTQPLAYIRLNGKLVLYALRACTDQLRAIHNISVEELSESEREGVFIVTAKMKNGQGRTDIAKGAVSISGLKGEALANQLMKCETKAKRRATLSLCGLGLLDETEVETIPGAVLEVPKSIAPHNPETGEVLVTSALISKEQKLVLSELIVETKTDTAKYLQYLKVPSLDDIPASMFSAAKAVLERKRDSK